MRFSRKRRRLGLVVPALAEGGGVPAVARFLLDTARRDGSFEPKLVSLSSTASDSSSLGLTHPASWFRGAIAIEDEWEGYPFIHVGACVGELEFQRYRPRQVLAEVLGNCDLVQVVCGSPAWASAVMGLGKPVALQVATRARVERRQRDASPRSLSGWWRRAMTEITDVMDDRALRSVDAIQVENPWMLEYARRLNIGRDVDIRYAPPGVDTELFRPADGRELGRDPYILCVARLNDPRKNIGLLLEAYAQLPATVRGKVRLVLAGSNAPPESFWQRAMSLALRDRITYVESPQRSVLVRLYQRASVLVLPSDEEGLGIVLLEAMACGVPVVSTRSGGPDGIVTEGEDGFLVSLDDAEGMASRLRQLLESSDLNLAMGYRARRKIEARYAENVAGQAFVEVWERLLAKAGSG